MVVLEERGGEGLRFLEGGRRVVLLFFLEGGEGFLLEGGVLVLVRYQSWDFYLLST